MKRIVTTTFAFFLFLSFSFSQSFVDPANEWVVYNCCYVGGYPYCTSDGYFFKEETVVIENTIYYELSATNEHQGIPGAKYFRENNGRVYFRATADAEEYLGYDFNAEQGDTLIIGAYETALIVDQVLTIEITNGEIRKRMEMRVPGEEQTFFYWVEGIGSITSPLNPSYFTGTSPNCWVNFNCFKHNGDVLYTIGDCMLTSTDVIKTDNRISVYPNPATNELFISGVPWGDIARINLLNDLGQIVEVQTTPASNKLPLRSEFNGLYYLDLHFTDGTRLLSKVIID